jgi:putative oxidoreductase
VTASAHRSGLIGAAAAIVARLDRLPILFAELFFRAALAVAFWRSGQAKLANWDLTLALFADEYRVPILPSELAAFLATTVEIGAPVALVLGLGVRLAAAAMLGMTLVIQLFVYPGSYPDHLLWAGPLLYLLWRGPGRLSLDHLIRKRCLEPRRHHPQG